MDETSNATNNSDTTRGFSRRSVIRTAAWTVPAVSVVVATPAFAASGSTLTASYNADSFRANSNADLTGGNPNATGAVAAVSMMVAVAGGAVTDLKCTITSAGNGFNIASNSVKPARGNTTWATMSGDLASAGFVASPAIGAGQSNSSVVTKGGTTANGAVLFQLVLGSLGSTDFPIVFKFSAADTAATTTVTLTSPTTTPFLAGTVS